MCRGKRESLMTSIRYLCGGAGHISKHCIMESLVHFPSAIRDFFRETVGQLQNSTLRRIKPCLLSFLSFCFLLKRTTREPVGICSRHTNLRAAFRWSCFFQHITHCNAVPMDPCYFMQQSKRWQWHCCAATRPGSDGQCKIQKATDLLKFC